MSSPVAIGKRFGHFKGIVAAALVIGLLQSGMALAAQSALRVMPRSLNFGREVFAALGATSNPQPVTISNPKTKAAQPLTIADFSVGGPNSGDFAVADPNNCKGMVLAPGESCVVQATFAPTSLGKRNGTFSATDAAGNSTKPVTLSGTGVRGVLLFSSQQLFFGRVQVDASGAEVVSLINDNPVALDVTGISTEGTGFTASQDCKGVLAGGGSCEVLVIFSPISAAKTTKGTTVSGTLIVADDAQNSPHTVRLSAVAFGPAVVPTPTPAAAPSPTPTPSQSSSPTLAATATPSPIPPATPSQTPAASAYLRKSA